jgi:RecJ-like exonuclease
VDKVMAEEKCAVCQGNGVIELLGSECPFCNGTGEPNKPAKAYLDSHICQCIFLDRKRCPLCGKNCHHDTPNKPKILLSPE